MKKTNRWNRGENMRILEVRFKNLNSLVGEWTIDFNHPAYTADGIFAITGPTGAGKTTILDAICLALYGRTPRLERVNKNDNEIIARHTGECFAEVCFETRTGRFRSHWSQHRARKKPGGELQNPRHEIINEDTGEILESKIRDVALTIENVTGMDFGRFTRSMLLAQGGFAAFLQALPDERAPILEQITGTEIYSQISIKVHQRRAEERKVLEALEAERAGIHLLNPEEENELNNDLQEKLNQVSELGTRVSSINYALTWLEGIDALQREIAILEKEWQGFQERQQQFSPALNRLNRAYKALAGEGDYQRVSALREQQRQEITVMEDAKQELPGREAEVHKMVALCKTMLEKAEQARTGQKSEAEKVRIVREMDLRLFDQQRLMEKAQVSKTETRKQCNECRAGLELIEKELQKSDGTKLEIENYLEQHAADAGLVENLAAISQLFAALQEKDISHRHGCRELAAAAEEMKSYHTSCQELAASYESLANTVNTAEQEYQQIAARLKILLNGRDLNVWREELEALQQRNIILQQCQASMGLISLTQNNLSKLHEQLKLLNQEKIKATGDIESYTEKTDFWEREIGHLNKELALLNRIYNLEEERQRLRDGEACPLCGATQHPFATGNIPALKDSELALMQAQEKLNEVRNILLQLQLKEIKLDKDMEQTCREINDKQGMLETETKRFQEVTASLKVLGSVSETYDQVEGELELTGKKIEDYKKVIVEVEQQGIIERNSYKALDEVRRAHLEMDKSLQHALFRQETAEREHARLLVASNTREEELLRLQQQVLQAVNSFGINELPRQDLNTVLDNLKQRRKKWQEAQLNKVAEEKNIADLKVEWGRQEERLARLNEEMQNWTQDYEQLLKDYNTLKLQRLELYEDKNPDIEENRWLEVVEQAEKNLEDARQERNRAEQEQSNLQVRIASLSDSIQKRARELMGQEEDLKIRLIRAGFVDEADYQSAALGEEERELLEKEAELLRREENELSARREDRISRLKAEREKMLTDEPYDKLKEDLDSTIRTQSNLQQDIYAIKYSLIENEKRQTEQQEKLKIIAAQKKECERWELLHELIGSADGKKYRNFAQGLTFEILVNHANRQLQKMSERYLLIRDQAQPLELNVIDNYQGGEIRSTKNLSGGESFIVSLALALGLSQMASRNVNIDSLFLDEGFGSLDEEVLDSALETLAGLQQEGKMIGIISHVPALKERISTQIEVIPKNGGYSRLQGPGCMEIKN